MMHKKIRIISFLSVWVLIALAACTETPPKKEVVELDPTIQVPEFSGDSAYQFVQQQVDFGPRVPNSAGHVACGNWLVAQLKAYGAKVQVQEAVVKAYDQSQLRMKNIIASYNPEKNRRVLLSAHWDTRPIADEGTERQNDPIPGANDGGSGVGVLLEMARHFNANTPAIGVDIILWDAEDYGKSNVQNSYGLGSQYWGRNKHKGGYRALYGVNLDMVGAKNAVFPQEGYSRQFASEVVSKIWNTAHRLGYGQYFVNQNHDPIVDDHYYMNSIGGIKTVDIIHLEAGTRKSFFEHWHTHGDNMDAIDPASLKAVGQTVMEVVYREK